MIKLLFTFLLIFFSINISSQNKIDKKDLEITFSGDAQIEVGSHYAGVEFHHSFPVPQRISFYYPVANSIDLSTDYWKRDSTFIMALGLRENDGIIRWLGNEPFEFISTPFSVTFLKTEQDKSIKISWDFSKNKPIIFLTIEITNLSEFEKNIELYTHLEISLRTSHTFKFIDEAQTKIIKNKSAIISSFDNIETNYAEIFTSNAGEQPKKISAQSNVVSKEKFWWDDSFFDLQDSQNIDKKFNRPASRYLYGKKLNAGETIKVVQIIGSAKINESENIIDFLSENYQNEINEYEEHVLKYVNEHTFVTGDKTLDQTTAWSKAVLAVNQHYIDGSIQPMPCPAEYNFYFTHDVLLADLAAVMFDLERVKNDLTFIIDHASEDKIIPHAYYWKDTAFVTEFTAPDGWNHFWFIIVSSAYLQHSADTLFVKNLYPFIKKSLEQTLLNLKDNLIWAYRPDWWDIGHNFGPRAYMTMLAINSIRNFLFISSSLNLNLDVLSEYEILADKMETALNEKLWSEEQKYFISYFADGSQDQHYYMGSLLASHFNLTSEERKRELITTAEEYLLDEKIGLYTLFPMDFHLLIDYLGFAGNEAGDPYKYANGGIWMHGNAWYALALMKIGEKEKAENFIKKIMTLDGIINSPNGQPAMYEYRNSNFNDPLQYGRIDKPQFMWAASWYLYSLYNLYGIENNIWNIGLNPFIGNDKEEIKFNLNVNGKIVDVIVQGKGENITSIKNGNKELHSLILPSDAEEINNLNLELGNTGTPILSSLNAILLSCELIDKKSLIISLKGFKGHQAEAEFILQHEPKSIIIDGEELISQAEIIQNKSNILFKIKFVQSSRLSDIILTL
jgi:glycogen debranching enzyme